MSSSTTEQPVFQEIVSATRRGRRFAVVSHARPDGDSIGSSLALALALRKLGKQASVVQADPVPSAYRLLAGVDTIRFEPRLDGDCDVLFVLESGSLERTGLEGLEGRFTVNIDHHAQAGDFGDLNWNDPSRAAVAELVLELIEALEVPLDADIASNLYVAILTDTGSFQFSNTRRETFQAASRLVEAGADPGTLARQVYFNQPLAKVLLLGRVLESLRLHAGGRIGTIVLTAEDFRATAAVPGDTEGLVNHALAIEGVDLVAFLRQEDGDEIRVSLRSKGSYDVAAVARALGGGGHVNAAGLSMDGTLETVRESIVGRLEELLG